MGISQPVDSIPMLNQLNRTPNQNNPVNKEQKPTSSKNTVNICAWNIRRGLLIREEELKLIIKSNKIGMDRFQDCCKA
jgi:hypothetical protein